MINYSIADALSGKADLDKTITLKGWVRTRRDSKAGISFIAVYDGSCFNPIQIVVPETLPNYQNEIIKLTAGCAISAIGKLVASPGKGQQYEMQAEEIQIIGWVDDPDTYPISPKHHTLEYLREVAHLRGRTNTFGAVSRIRHTAAQAIHRFFDNQKFFWIPTPIITASDCEGAGELFKVSILDFANLPRHENGKVDFTQDFFGKEAYLTVSGQLNLETYALAISKVYSFGPTFRAENSNTSRHLAEFWMIEPEIAFANLQDDANLAEAMLKFIFKTVLDERADDMAFFAERVDKKCIERLEHMVNTPFERMEYTEAVSMLEKSSKTFEFAVKWGVDLQSEHERYLAEELLGRPVILMNYPKDIKAFYMRLNDDEKTVAAMDVLAPGIGEIIGGSQREERLDILDKRLDQMCLPVKNYEWYRDLRRYGTVPHAGFGLGFERLLSYITGLGNVRDLIPFPRTPGNADF
ncbi:MAG: asparagine--tRNA ligase [Gammaproteobacteria bacterium]